MERLDDAADEIPEDERTDKTVARLAETDTHAPEPDDVVEVLDLLEEAETLFPLPDVTVLDVAAWLLNPALAYPNNPSLVVAIRQLRPSPHQQEQQALRQL